MMTELHEVAGGRVEPTAYPIRPTTFYSATNKNVEIVT